MQRGHVVNIGSLAAKSAARWLGAYPATKFAVAAYSQQLRLELGPQGLHVLLVCPGPIQRSDPRLYPLEGLEDIPDRARGPGRGEDPGHSAGAACAVDPSGVRASSAGVGSARFRPAVVRHCPAFPSPGRLDRAAENIEKDEGEPEALASGW